LSNQSTLEQSAHARLISEKRATLGKTYGIKVWCNWEHLGEHIRNSKQKKGGKRKPQNIKPHSPLERKSPGSLALGAHSITSLDGQNFYTYICLSPLSNIQSRDLLPSM